MKYLPYGPPFKRELFLLIIARSTPKRLGRAETLCTGVSVCKGKRELGPQPFEKDVAVLRHENKII